MRVMVAGLDGAAAARLLQGVREMVSPDRVVADWHQLESAIQQDRPDVVLLNLGDRPGQELAMARRVLALYPSLQIIALSAATTPDLVKMVSAAGCVDHVLLPQCPSDLRRALYALQKRGAEDIVEGEAVAVLGAKGGVGATTIACNLADALASRGGGAQRVALVDLDLYMGDAALILDVNPSPSTLFFLKRAAQADAKTWLEGPPRHRRGFRLMGLDGDLETADPVTAEQVVFLVERLRQRYHYVILDCGSDVSEASMAACSTADRRLLIVTEQLSARLGARRRVTALRAMDPDKRDIQGVVNRFQGNAQTLQALEQAIGVPVLETLSNAWSDMSASLEKGRTLLESAPNATITADFRRLAEKLSGAQHQEEKRKKAFFNFFR